MYMIGMRYPRKTPKGVVAIIREEMSGVFLGRNHRFAVLGAPLRMTFLPIPAIAFPRTINQTEYPIRSLTKVPITRAIAVIVREMCIPWLSISQLVNIANVKDTTVLTLDVKFINKLSTSYKSLTLLVNGLKLYGYRGLLSAIKK